MSLDYATKFSLLHDIIVTSHCSCQKISEEASETSLNYIKLTIVRDNKVEDFTRLC